MQNSGLVGIYSHSKKHVFYNKLPVREVHDDVLESYKIIEDNLGKKDFNKNYVKRINIPCAMTGREILEEIENMFRTE